MKHSAELIKELLHDPRRFWDQGRAYELLQTYFAEPLDSLRPLLRNSDAYVRRVAAFVASELGERARELLGDIIPLMSSGDRYLKYNALEIVGLCSSIASPEEFVHVVKALEDTDEVVRVLAMRLMSRASEQQFQAAASRLESRADAAHTAGLAALAERKRPDDEALNSMDSSSDPLSRRYGAIVRCRLLGGHGDVLRLAGGSVDPDVRAFWRSVKPEPNA